MSNADLKCITLGESLLQRILKFLKTERNRYPIYDIRNNVFEKHYGTSLYETIGFTYTSVNLSRYSREIREFLLGEYDVKSVESIVITPVSDKLLVDISLTSEYEKIQIKEVLDNLGQYYKGV